MLYTMHERPLMGDFLGRFFAIHCGSRQAKSLIVYVSHDCVPLIGHLSHWKGPSGAPGCHGCHDSQLTWNEPNQLNHKLTNKKT